MKLRAIVLSLITAVAALTIGSSAHAEFRRYASSYCVGTTQPTYANNSGLTGNNSTGTLAYLCPVFDDNAFNHTSVATLNMHVYLQSGTFSAWACVQDPYSGSQSCGNQTNDTTTGGPYAVQIQQGSNAYGNKYGWLASDYSYWFPFIYVSVPGHSSGSMTSIAGYYVADVNG